MDIMESRYQSVRKAGAILAFTLLAGAACQMGDYGGRDYIGRDGVQPGAALLPAASSDFAAIDSGRPLLAASTNHSALMNFAAPNVASPVNPPVKPVAEKEKIYSVLPERALKYQPYVERHSEKFQVCRILIYAIIRVESNFDSMAASPASAYGLMQLVPESGGRHAFRTVYGSDETPSRDYLYDPDRNIELGTAYLKLLASDFFARVEDPLSREYCQIAAYNTGVGNVLKAFGDGFSEAIAMINSLSAPEVYEHLTVNLRHEEARNYLPKVLSFQRQYASLEEGKKRRRQAEPGARAAR